MYLLLWLKFDKNNIFYLGFTGNINIYLTFHLEASKKSSLEKNQN